MPAFLDTSVLVATFYGDHEHHEESFGLFLEQARDTGCTAAHCLAEAYSVITGMPGSNRASPDEALLFLQDVRERLSTVALNEREYFETLKAAARANVCGGTTYDALIAHCALKAKAESLYTWNVKHFNRLGPQIAALVRSP